jgi:hypothetical protein
MPHLRGRSTTPAFNSDEYVSIVSLLHVCRFLMQKVTIPMGA